MGQWENLPADLLIEIEKFVILYADKVRFCSVCKSWKSALPRMPDLKFPCLLYPCNEASQSSYGLFNVLDHKTYYLDLPINTKRILLRGSAHGWVVSVVGPYDEIYLINPFSRAKIQLPSRSKFPDVDDYCADRHDEEYSIWNFRHGRCHLIDSRNVRNNLTDKFILSSNPSLTDDYVVVGIYGEGSGLAYCKHGDEKWTSLLGIEGGFLDVIFCQGKIHAVMHGGWLQVFDIHPDNPQVEELAPPYYFYGGRSLPYIVESSNGLLLVERQIKTSKPNDHINEYVTHHFNVFKLDHASSRWSKITDIGDEALFIGFNTSVSRSSLEFSELRRNTIYFTDNILTYHYERISGGSDIGVFDLNSESMEPLPGYKCDSFLVWPPPIWLLPTPY